MFTPTLDALIAVCLVSALSLLGALFFFIQDRLLATILIPLVSISTGALLGDVFLHIIPDLSEGENDFSKMMMFVLLGILGSFIIEKLIHWRHCHTLPTETHEGCAHDHEHYHPVGILSVIGESAHNFIDGITIASSFLVSFEVGIATTLAVALHEIPHEIGNVAILLHSGYSRTKALLLNMLSASAAILGVLLVIGVQTLYVQISPDILLAFAGGNLLYIAGCDLIPELHKHVGMKHTISQFLAMSFGMVLMYGMLFLE